MAGSSPNPLLVVRDLAVSFASGATRTQAVDGVSMTIYPRQTLAVVGESGCGKSVTALSLLHLLPTPPARIDRGAATFDGRELLSLPLSDIRAVRGRHISMIFQEPMTSLNPVFTIGDQIIEAVLLHQDVDRHAARAIALRAMHDVGIADPESRLGAYPHQFSGGMRQRVMIAMALACKPRLLLADEPTTALDVTIQKQILALLRDLKRTSDLAIMLITHDLGVVAENADVVCVMYAGRVVEYAAVTELFAHPLHPYTRGLLACIPSITNRRERLSTIAELMDQPGAFDLRSSNASAPPQAPAPRPWWPTHTPPANLTAGDSVLHEIRPNHWIVLWRTPDLAISPPRPPDLDFLRASDRSHLIPCTP
jgi:ABC-type dipeptide/oligopeptide/nickel transport system ATPase component